MIAIAHALVAGAIAAKVPNPLIAAPLALGSHFILDSVPHWDFGTDWKKRAKFITGILGIADTIAGFVIAWLVFGSHVHTVLLFLCVTVSLLPDWLEAPLYIFFVQPGKEKIRKHAGVMERFFHGVYTVTNIFHTKTTFVWGVLSQIVVVALILWVLQ